MVRNSKHQQTVVGMPEAYPNFMISYYKTDPISKNEQGKLAKKKKLSTFQVIPASFPDELG